MEVTEVVRLRRAVLTHLAEHTWRGDLPEHVKDIIYTLVRMIRPVSAVVYTRNGRCCATGFRWRWDRN